MAEISYQLYSSRNFPPLSDTLKMLAQLGYSAVEGYGGMIDDTLDAAALRSVLDENELKMPSCHIGLEHIVDSTAETIALAKTLGIGQIYVPIAPDSDRQQNAEGWTRLGESLEGVAQVLGDADLKLGWHNHDFEFSRTETNDLPLDLILAAAPSISLELDVAWAVVAKQDPLQTIEKYAHKLSAIHVKDLAAAGECADEDGWADVGEGTMDWATLITAVNTIGLDNFVMEHDNPNDHQRFAKRSIKSLKQLLGAS